MDVRQELIFAPMGALAIFTGMVLLLVPIMRVVGVSRRKVAIDDFKLGESQKVPGHVALPNRNYMNLLEFPLLFYVICLMNYAAHSVDRTTLLLAWCFVGIRFIHSLIHLTINIVGLRAIIFGLGTVPVAAMWVLFLLKQFPGGFQSAVGL